MQEKNKIPPSDQVLDENRPVPYGRFAIYITIGIVMLAGAYGYFFGR